ncbi:MAG: hypothetical protein ABI548_27090 [Polyangiaceae bacterium]
MTKKQDTTDDEARKTWMDRNSEVKTRADRSKLDTEWLKAKSQIEDWLAKNAADITASVRDKVADKALGRFLQEGKASPETYAKWELATATRPNSQGERRHLIVAPTPTGDTPEPPAEPELSDRDRARLAKADTLLNEYAERFGVTLEAARALAEDREIVLERGRFRKPNHFYDDEQEDLINAAIKLCGDGYEAAWQTHWSADQDRAAQWVKNQPRENIDIELEARKAVEILNGALEKANVFVSATPRTLDGQPYTGGVCVKFLCGVQKALELMRDDVTQVLSGPTGYLKPGTGLHYFIGAVLTHQDFAQDLGCTRSPNLDELLDIWLLSGARVDIHSDTWAENPEGFTPSFYRAKMRETVVKAYKQYTPTPWRAPDRSPTD